MKCTHELLADDFLLMEAGAAGRLRSALQMFSESGDETSLKASLARWAVAPLQAAISQQQAGSVAIVTLAGPIMPRSNFLTEMGYGTGLDAFTRAMLQADADSSVTGVLILADTPGGQIYGIPEGSALVRDISARKPVGVHIMGMNASAGYWLTSGAKFIAGGETADAGAIGVYVVNVDASAAMEREGYKITVVSAGKHKADGIMGLPMSADGMAALKARVESAYGMFTRDVAAGREVTAAAVRDGFGEGRLVMGAEAKKAGLIDYIGTLESSFARLAGRRAGGGARAEDDLPPLAMTIDETELAAPPALAAVDPDAAIRERLERI